MTKISDSDRLLAKFIYLRETIHYFNASYAPEFREISNSKVLK